MHFLLSAILFLTIGFGAPAIAQPNGCDKAKSTAETLDCLNRHKTAVQDQLQSIYDKLQKKAGADPAWQKSLSETQTAWLAYRIKECAWETASSEAPALEKIYEISCINRLTEQRIEALAAILHRSEENSQTPEFGPTPRWLNVLAEDYPAIFWRQSSLLSADLDCDNHNEQVIPGIRVSSGGTGAAGPETIVAHIAIAQNPVTGRPRIKTIELPVTGTDTENSGPHLCSTDIRLTLTDYPASTEEKPQETAPVAHQCTNLLQVSDAVCPPVLIHWNGTSYAIMEAEAQ